jgi:hypothetical protein
VEAVARHPPGDPVAGGLGPALKALARRSAVPVELEVDLQGRPPAPVEVAASYVVSEALTNAAKHAHASVVHIDLRAHEGTCTCRSVTTASAAPTHPAAPGSMGSATACRRWWTEHNPQPCRCGHYLLIDFPVDPEGG